MVEAEVPPRTNAASSGYKNIVQLLGGTSSTTRCCWLTPSVNRLVLLLGNYVVGLHKFNPPSVPLPKFRRKLITGLIRFCVLYPGKLVEPLRRVPGRGALPTFCQINRGKTC
eukprot:scaffold6795_cov110-Cylindrotheca_fusiformis.AAC.2